jgi:hypothetical protein
MSKLCDYKHPSILSSIAEMRPLSAVEAWMVQTAKAVIEEEKL